ncbi:MAG: 50S ribosomal protein L3 [Chloroflexota bacterium]|nr:50S ribosomal protein L3 [Chloroflexota bacterium]
MFTGIIGRKIGMTQFLQESGEAAAVTAVEAGPCVVTQLKTQAENGYSAIQLGFEETKHLNAPESGHLKDMTKFRYLREFRIEDAGMVKRGDKVDVSFLKSGDLVNVSGFSKGKGFAGVVKRYHFAGGFKTHGQSDRHRAPGSIGATTSPGRVLKGKHMAGHLGNRKITLHNIQVLQVEPNRNLLLLKGAVPGASRGLLIIRKAKE